MPHQHTRIDESTLVPAGLAGKLITYLCGLAVSGAIALATSWTLMSARVDSAQAEIIQIKTDRAKSLDIWNQDRIENAGFKSAVMTKLDRIEKKLDR